MDMGKTRAHNNDCDAKISLRDAYNWGAGIYQTNNYLCNYVNANIQAGCPSHVRQKVCTASSIDGIKDCSRHNIYVLFSVVLCLCPTFLYNSWYPVMGEKNRLKLEVKRSRRRRRRRSWQLKSINCIIYENRVEC